MNRATKSSFETPVTLTECAEVELLFGQKFVLVSSCLLLEKKSDPGLVSIRHRPTGCGFFITAT